jgi:hypothetical protein
MVAQSGVEPETQAYETRMIPFHYRAIKNLIKPKMAGRLGFEPSLGESKSPVLPLHKRPMVDDEGFEPPTYSV